MISCPAANGIICSSCSPMATLAPSGTSSAMAERMETSLDTLLLPRLKNALPQQLGHTRQRLVELLPLHKSTPRVAFTPKLLPAPPRLALLHPRFHAFV